MESIYTKLALYGRKNESARTDTVFLPMSEVCNGTVSLESLALYCLLRKRPILAVGLELTHDLERWYTELCMAVFNRPAVAKAVLQKALNIIKSINGVPPVYLKRGTALKNWAMKVKLTQHVSSIRTFKIDENGKVH